MKTHYILHITFLLAFCICGFIYGPVLIVRTFSDYHKPTKSRLENLSVKGLPANLSPYRYLDLEIQVEGLKLKKFCYIADRDYVFLEDFLIQSDFLDIDDKSDLYSKFPICVSSVDECAPQNVEYKFNNDRKLVVLSIDGFYVIGKNYFATQKIVGFVFGLILFISAILFPIVGIKLLIKNLDGYKKSGNLPPLTDKIAGINYLFGLFKSPTRRRMPK